MKVLFLDIDGVLVVNGPDEGLTLAHFEPRALKELARVIKTTEARIVLHSSWRYHPHKKAVLNAALAQHGVGPIFSQTKFTYLWEVDSKPIQVVRVDEILHWLEAWSGQGPVALRYGADELSPSLPVARHLALASMRCALPPPESVRVMSWAVVDDCSLEEDGRLGERFVRTEEHVGLTSQEADRLIELLR